MKRALCFASGAVVRRLIHTPEAVFIVFMHRLDNGQGYVEDAVISVLGKAVDIFDLLVGRPAYQNERSRH